MIPVLLAYFVVGCFHGEKIRKSTVRSLMEQPIFNFRQLPSAPKAVTVTKIRREAAGSLQLSNSAEILPRVASGREQEAASENPFFPRLSNFSDCYANRP